MNMTQQHVRRRGSSLDEAAIRQTLAQGLLRPNLEEKGQAVQDPFDLESPAFPVPPDLNRNRQIMETPASLMPKNVAIAMLIAAMLGFTIAAITTPKPAASTLLTIPSRLSRERTLAECMRNATKYCPHFPENVLQSDYPNRFSQDSASLCYKEDPEVNNRCESTCEMLFRKVTGDTDGVIKVTLACHVGCKYARREKETNATNCHWDCKNTVWAAVDGKEKCNYDVGLGLATAEFENRYGTGMFGSGKACEMGCIIGNSRPCPYCDKRTLTLSA